MTALELNSLIETVAAVKSRLFRIMQDAEKAQKMMREVEDKLYEIRADQNRVTSLRRGSQIAADAKAQDTR